LNTLTTRDLLAALQLPGVGPSTVRKLYEMASSGSSAGNDEIFDWIATLPGRRSPSLSRSDITVAYAAADQIFDRSSRHSVQVISALDVTYPRALFDVSDFPPVLYVKGSLATLTNPKKLAVVGTRHASELGLRLARKIASELSDLGVCVVSGLALGIDTAAHEGAIKGSGSTVAVLAHGLDQVAPKSNERLAAEILEKNGVLLSEYEIGIIPRPPQFVFRNRLQSGLSSGSVVVESGFSGGSIHQGKFTTQQHRFLFVVTPDQTLPGASEFQRAGAERLRHEFKGRPVTRLEDILDALPDFRFPSEGASPVAEKFKPTNGATIEGNSQGSLFD
jgi:DNA processing protein